MSEAATQAATQVHAITISDGAAQRIKTLVEMEDKPNTMLRITVSGGGCSGFQYSFGLDDTTNDDDLTFERNGIKVIIDETSIGFLDGSELDFKQEMIGSYFQMTNPNATSTCGCGSSFSV